MDIFLAAKVIQVSLSVALKYMGSGQQEKPCKSTNSIPKFAIVLRTEASIWGYLTEIIQPKKGAYFIITFLVDR
jgi:hypothetical protein